jgi:hypothetical protein
MILVLGGLRCSREREKFCLLLRARLLLRQPNGSSAEEEAAWLRAQQGGNQEVPVVIGRKIKQRTPSAHPIR